MENKEVEYEEKILIYFDVLGFKEIVKNNSAEQIYKVLRAVHGYSEPRYNCETIWFSDSIIQIYEYPYKYADKNDQFSFYHYFNNILGTVNLTQLSMLVNYNVLIRGSIVIGDVYYNKDEHILFGNALIQAYELESQCALYPRIVIDDSVMKKLPNFEDFKGLELTRDIDGIYFADPTKYMVQTNSEKPNLQLLIGTLEKLIESTKGERLPKVSSKYRWLLNKLNDRINTDLSKT